MICETSRDKELLVVCSLLCLKLLSLSKDLDAISKAKVMERIH